VACAQGHTLTSLSASGEHALARLGRLQGEETEQGGNDDEDLKNRATVIHCFHLPSLEIPDDTPT